MRPAAKPGLVRGLVSAWAIFQFGVGASSPLTVVVGGLTTMYAATGVVGVPLSFPIIGVCLGLLSVGFLAVSYRQQHAGAAYAALAVGLGPRWGVAGGFLAVVVYPALQIALYGLIGSNAAGLLGFGTWQMWAWATWSVVTLVGMLRYTMGQFAVAAVTVVELLLIAMMAFAAFAHPHGGHISTAPMTLSALWPEHGQIGGVFAFGIAAFLGYESGPAYSEEIKNDGAIIWATGLTLAFLTIFYMLVAWSLAVWTGPDYITTAATPELPFTILSRYWDAAGPIAELFLITSVAISILSFHNTTTRYLYGLARERVLFGGLALVGKSEGRLGGTPWRASLAQSGLVAVALAVFQLAGADPIKEMFVWLSAGAAFGVLVLLVGVSVAAVLYFRSGQGGRESVWVRTVLPVIGAIVGGILAAVIGFNQSTLLGVADHSPWQMLIPACVGGIVLVGLIWAGVIKSVDPERYAGVGRGQPDPLTEPDLQLADVRV